MASKIRVAMLDDHLMTLIGYQSELEKSARIEVVGTAFYGVELEPLLERTPVDVLLLDIRVPTSPDNANPYPILHAIPSLLQKYPDLIILIISMYSERAMIQAVLDAGASGYIMKDDNTALRGLASIIASLRGGGIFLSPQAAQKLSKRLSKSSGHDLTPRQLEVLSLSAAYPGATTADIAKIMGVSNSTVRNLLSNAYVRLGVRSRMAAVDKARNLGLITPLGEHSSR